VIDRREQALTYVLLGVFSLIALVPIAGIVLTALQPPGELASFGEPTGFHAENFATAWDEGRFGSYLRSSAIVTAGVVVLATVLSVLAGYAFGMMRFRGNQVLFYVFLLGLMVPLESTVVPLYYDLRDLGLTDTYWALILPQAGLSIAFGTFWMRAFFRSVPRSLVEAARLDGASSWSTLWRVLLPFGRPAVLTMVVLIFMWTWNEFLHDVALAACRRLGDRRHAGGRALRVPAAPLHPRDAQRGGEGLDDRFRFSGRRR
jgi:raffinose/stachyose/melibiose transport system permease protein